MSTSSAGKSASADGGAPNNAGLGGGGAPPTTGLAVELHALRFGLEDLAAGEFLAESGDRSVDADADERSVDPDADAGPSGATR